jgi:hypothetical protein
VGESIEPRDESDELDGVIDDSCGFLGCMTPEKHWLRWVSIYSGEVDGESRGDSGGVGRGRVCL